jgi:hypothetical protein
LGSGVKMKLVLIPPEKFIMGTPGAGGRWMRMDYSSRTKLTERYVALALTPHVSLTAPNFPLSVRAQMTPVRAIEQPS